MTHIVIKRRMTFPAARNTRTTSAKVRKSVIASQQPREIRGTNLAPGTGSSHTWAIKTAE